MNDFMILPEKSLLGNEISMEMLTRHVKPRYIDLFKKDVVKCEVRAILRSDTCGIPAPTEPDDFYSEIVYLTVALNNENSYEIIAKQILLTMPRPVVLTMTCNGRYAHATAAAVNTWKYREYLNKLDSFCITHWFYESTPSPLAEIDYSAYSSYKSLFVKICSAIEDSAENFIRISFLAKVVMYCRGFDMDEDFNKGACITLSQEIKANCKSVAKWGSGDREVYLFAIDDAYDFIAKTCHYVPGENFADLIYNITELEDFDLELPKNIQGLVDQLDLDFYEEVENLAITDTTIEDDADDSEYYSCLMKTFHDMLKTDR